MSGTVFTTKKSVFFVGGRRLDEGLSDNLIAHYKMNDNLATDVILDAIGNHNGAVKDVGGTATSAFHSVAGKINNAQDFEGTDDYIEIPDHADFTPALTPFSISAWVYMHDATTFVIANKGVYNTDGEWHFFIGGDDKLNIYLYDESVLSCRIGRFYNTVLTGYENQWIHLVMTYDGGRLSSGLKLYLNGLRVDDTNTEINAASFVAVENLAHDVWIGNYDNAYYANGLIDNMMFFNKELMVDDVGKLHASGYGTELDNGDVNNGGGCTKEYWGDLKNPNKTLADVMGPNGEPVSNAAAWNGSQTGVDVVESTETANNVKLEGVTLNAEVGHVVNIEFAGIYPDGRYEVIAKGLSDELEIDLAYSSDTTCDAKVGGAFDKVQTASDVTDAANYNVEILTNKDETFTGVGDQIDIDVGGGDGASDTWKRIIGIDDDGIELAKYSYVNIDANGYACHVFKILDVECIEFRHIYPKDTANTHHGFYITATGFYQGFLLKDCKSTGCKYGVYSDAAWVRGLTIMGGYYSSASGYALYFSAVRWVNVIEVELVSSLGVPLIQGNVVGTLLFDGCVLRKTAGHVAGILTSVYDTFLVIRNCVFYDMNVPIILSDPESRLIEYNNIFILHTAATDLIINPASGAIKYSDYSCAWAMNGAPAAANRWGGRGIGEHSIEADPLFMDAAGLDFRLESTSPCLRTGRPTLGEL